MKNWLSTLFFLFFVSFTFAQSQQETKDKILADNKSILDAMDAKNYDAILDLTHPALYKIVDREMLKGAFKQIFEGNDELNIEILKSPNAQFTVSDIMKTKDNASEYAFVTYPISMKMTYLKNSFEPSQYATMEDIFKQQGMNAKFLSKNEMEVSKLSLSIAVKDASTNNQWKYVNYEPNNMMFASIIPEEIMNKAKEYNTQLESKK